MVVTSDHRVPKRTGHQNAWRLTTGYPLSANAGNEHAKYAGRTAVGLGRSLQSAISEESQGRGRGPGGLAEPGRTRVRAGGWSPGRRGSGQVSGQDGAFCVGLVKMTSSVLPKCLSMLMPKRSTCDDMYAFPVTLPGRHFGRPEPTELPILTILPLGSDTELPKLTSARGMKVPSAPIAPALRRAKQAKCIKLDENCINQLRTLPRRHNAPPVMEEA